MTQIYQTSQLSHFLLMGIPDFYRWITKKYPKSVVNATETMKPFINEIEQEINLNESNPNNIEYDNFYLDMNG